MGYYWAVGVQAIRGRLSKEVGERTKEVRREVGGSSATSCRRKRHGEDLVDVLLRLQHSSELNFVITSDVIKIMFTAVIDFSQELFSAGVETSSTTAEWVISELIKNPQLMSKAQAVVRRMLKGRIQETDIQGLNYLKNIVKETLRLHPPIPLMPGEAREECTIRGYRIPQKIRVVMNLSMLGRDPNYWSDPESFKHERFEESGIDIRGGSFEYIPFGSGRRICPGMNFGLRSIELPLV
ncbi:hypothetical protein MLD38_035665 [Melastoma candidum]|uniref:Uncharacterized protein n=1 Tax=Melastoma candidum TaxID=119954 RepID=A0ACB9LH88_9MYRT|nr:hypothetical protein MLD38_035665 [Melastoma candidum]